MLGLLFSPRCVSCGTNGPPLCEGCAGRVSVIIPPLCARCGRPTEERLTACADCPPRPVEVARAPFVYDGPVAQAIRALKFRGWGWLARPLAGAMVEALGAIRADAVTWVPLSGRRRARRGYDQAELLARAVAGRLDLPAVRLLRRARDTPAQARRSGPERRASLRGAFRAARSAPGAVLLVDDVLTTGATTAACAEALLGAGANRVAVLTAARSLGSGVPARCLGGYNRSGPSPGSVVARGNDSR